MKRFLSVEEVAERYGCSVRVVHGATAEKRIPFMKRQGFRRLMFDPAHLDAWDAGQPLETEDLEDGILVRPRTQE
jgi:excisionase family DNA binding protein